MIERIVAVVVGVSLAGLVSACDVHKLKTSAKNALDAIRGRVPPSQAPSKLTPAERQLQESSQLLHEMFQVVLLREPYSDEFAGYVNSLSQGGSLEGIYNGFVNSTQYQKLEDTAAPAYRGTIQAFALIASSFQQTLSKAKMHPSDLGVSAPYDPMDYEKAFGRAPFYGLKRVLGAEALRVVDEKLREDKTRESLIHWYTGFVTQMAAFNVDFGLPQRNQIDPAFHENWIRSLPADVVSDRVMWEVLNRVHRVLDAAEAAGARAKPASGK